MKICSVTTKLVIRREATDLQFAARRRSLASLGMTIPKGRTTFGEEACLCLFGDLTHAGKSYSRGNSISDRPGKF